MTPQTEKRNKIKSDMQKVLDKVPEAHLVSGRYKLIYHSLKEIYPHLMEQVSKDTMLEFLKDVVYTDRLVRLKTEGEDKESKDKAEVEMLSELGYTI